MPERLHPLPEGDLRCGGHLVEPRLALAIDTLLGGLLDGLGLGLCSAAAAATKLQHAAPQHGPHHGAVVALQLGEEREARARGEAPRVASEDPGDHRVRGLLRDIGAEAATDEVGDRLVTRGEQRTNRAAHTRRACRGEHCFELTELLGGARRVVGNLAARCDQVAQRTLQERATNRGAPRRRDLLELTVQPKEALTRALRRRNRGVAQPKRIDELEHDASRWRARSEAVRAALEEEAVPPLRVQPPTHSL